MIIWSNIYVYFLFIAYFSLSQSIVWLISCWKKMYKTFKSNTYTDNVYVTVMHMFTGPQSIVSIENFITEMRDRTWQLFQGRCILVVSFLLLDLFHLQALVIPTLGLKWGNESTASVVPAVTYVQEASSREGKDPGSSDLHRVDGVKGESSQSPQHPDTGCPDLSLSRLPPVQPVISKNLWTDDNRTLRSRF